MNPQFLKIVTMLMLPILISGCSTVFGRHHDEETVFFDSNVQNVEILCSGKRAKTPGSIPLRQSKSHSCTAELEGYEKKIFRIQSGTSGSGFGHSTAVNTAIWGWWTLGIGTGIGWLIDWASGAMRNLKEDNLYIEMQAEGTTSASSKVLDKTVSVGKDIVNASRDTVQNTASAAVDTTVHAGAQIVGVDAQPAKVDDSPHGKPKVI
jgi:hypothetical protein